MKCSEARLLLQRDFLEDRTTSFSDDLQVHLITCNKCRTHRDELKNIYKTFQRDKMSELPVGTVRSLKEELESSRSSRRIKKVIFFLTACAGVALIIFFINHQHDSGEGLDQAKTNLTQKTDDEGSVNLSEDGTVIQVQADGTTDQVSEKQAKENSGEKDSGGQFKNNFDKISEQLSTPVKGDVKAKEIIEKITDKDLKKNMDFGKMDRVTPLEKQKEELLKSNEKNSEDQTTAQDLKPVEQDEELADHVKNISELPKNLKLKFIPKSKNIFTLQKPLEKKLEDQDTNKEQVQITTEPLQTKDLGDMKKEAISDLSLIASQQFQVNQKTFKEKYGRSYEAQIHDDVEDVEDDSQDGGDQNLLKDVLPVQPADSALKPQPTGLTGDILAALFLQDELVSCENQSLDRGFAVKFDDIRVELKSLLLTNGPFYQSGGNASQDLEISSNILKRFLKKSDVIMSPEDLIYYLGFQPGDRMMYTLLSDDISDEAAENLLLQVDSKSDLPGSENALSSLTDRERMKFILEELDQSEQGASPPTSSKKNQALGQAQFKQSGTDDYKKGYHLNYCEELPENLMR